MLPAILILDDEEEMLQFLERILHEDYSVFKAGSGEEGLQSLSAHSIQLIISDVMMPGMDGFEFCSIIKSNIEYSHIPVLLLTAKNTIQSKIEGLETGADAYIEKPFSKQYLLAQISSLLTNRIHVRNHFATSPLAHINTIAHSKSDEQFLKQLDDIISENLENEAFDVEMIARSLYMSRTSLYRKIKAMSNFTPLEIINITRLKKAAEWLALGNYKIYEVAAMTGFLSQSNFTRSFQKQFGLTPTDYIRQKSGERS